MDSYDGVYHIILLNIRHRKWVITFVSSSPLKGRCSCCGREFSTLSKSAAKRKRRDASRIFKINSNDMASWFKANKESICRSFGYPIHDEIEVCCGSLICPDCRTRFYNACRNSSNPFSSQGQVTSSPSSHSSRREETYFLESLDQPSTSRGNRPPPIAIDELCESFSEASLTPSVREFSHSSKFPRFSSPDRANLEMDSPNSDSDVDQDPSRAQGLSSSSDNSSSSEPSSSEEESSSSNEELSESGGNSSESEDEFPGSDGESSRSDDESSASQEESSDPGEEAPGSEEPSDNSPSSDFDSRLRRGIFTPSTETNQWAKH